MENVFFPAYMDVNDDDDGDWSVPKSIEFLRSDFMRRT